MRVINGVQLRAARAMLGWSVQRMAEEAGVAISTVKRIEAADGLSNVTVAKLGAVTSALEATGRIRFEGDYCVCYQPK